MGIPGSLFGEKIARKGKGNTSSYKKLSYAGPSKYELRQEYSFLLFSKAFMALQGFIYHKFNDFIFFCVFDGFLKKKKTTVTFIVA